MMTRQQILDGLDLVVQRLAPQPASVTGEHHDVPREWTPHEWAYVCGIASHAILRLRDQLASGDPR